MKRIGWMTLLYLVLALALSAPALAATAIALDGKTYVFHGDQSVYEADGMTFIMDGNTVRVQTPGKADRVFHLEAAVESTTVVEEKAAPGTESAISSEATVSHQVGVVEDAQPTTGFAYSVDTEAVEAKEGSASKHYSKYDIYAKYGLSYDAAKGILYYQGRQVRVFEDSYFIDSNSCCVSEHFDRAGVVDVKALRDLSLIGYNDDGSYDPSGMLTGLRALTDAEFTARDLTEWINPPRQITAEASSGDPMTPAEKQALYAPYAAHGLSYDMQTDTFSYQGQLVRRFLDVKQSNGESFSGGRFKGVMTSISNDYGDVDVTILRDYAKPDAEGNGAITGIDVQPAK